MELNEDAIKLLNQISKNTGATAKAVGAKTEGFGGSTASEFGGVGDALGKITKESKGLFSSFGKLGAAMAEQTVAATRVVTRQGAAQREHSKIQKEASQSLQSLSEQLKKQASSNGILRASTTLVSETINKMIGSVQAQIDGSDDLYADSEKLGATLQQANDIMRKHTERNADAVRGLTALQGMLIEAAEAGEDLIDVEITNKKAIDEISISLNRNGLSLSALGNKFREAGGDIDVMSDYVTESLRELSDTTDVLSEGTEKLTEVEEKLTAGLTDSIATEKKGRNDRTKAATGLVTQSLGKMMGTVSKLFIGAAMAMVARMGSVLGQTQQSGFEVGTAKDMDSLLAGSFLMGISPEEATRFAAANREVLTTLTKSSMLAAGNGTMAIEQFGDVIQENFGMVGEQQLNMVGRGLNALANMGVDPSNIAKFTAFSDGVEAMAKSSSMSADEIFSEFEDMSKNPDFLGLLMSFGKEVDASTFLTDSFLNLAETVGLNADEFMKYRKMIADERRTPAVERVVQGVMAAKLAASLGFSQAEQDLIQQGKSFYGSLDAETVNPATGKTQVQDFDTTINKLSMALAKEQAEAEKNQELFWSTQLKILSEGGAVDPLITTSLRQTVDEMRKYLPERVAAAGKGAEKSLLLTSTMKEIILGASKSPLGLVEALNDDVYKEIFDDLKKNFGGEEVALELQKFLGPDADAVLMGAAAYLTPFRDGVVDATKNLIGFAEYLGWLTPDKAAEPEAVKNVEEVLIDRLVAKKEAWELAIFGNKDTGGNIAGIAAEMNPPLNAHEINRVRAEHDAAYFAEMEKASIIIKERNDKIEAEKVAAAAAASKKEKSDALLVHLNLRTAEASESSNKNLEEIASPSNFVTGGAGGHESLQVNQ